MTVRLLREAGRDRIAHEGMAPRHGLMSVIWECKKEPTVANHFALALPGEYAEGRQTTTCQVW